MNTIITSREAILEGCRKLIQKEGPSGLSIRKLADSMNISTGSIYHYFSSKSALLEAAIESVWMEIFSDYGRDLYFDHFEDCVNWIFSCLRESEKRYPGFLELHSTLVQDRALQDTKGAMWHAWHHLRGVLSESLKHDPSFSDRKDQSVQVAGDAVFSLILSSVYLHWMDEKSVLAFVRQYVLH